MAENASALLASWSTFYVMTGSSAAALTGLMFVVITLVTGPQRRQKASEGISTFSTPTVVHFAAALFVAAVFSAPWHSLRYPGTLIGIAGLCGIVYVARIMLRARRLRTYAADLEDWAFHGILPLIAYITFLAGAVALFGVPVPALFAIAGAALLLIFIGIHNAWDIVTFLAIGADEPTN